MALRDRPERATAPPESHVTGPTAVALRLRRALRGGWGACGSRVAAVENPEGGSRLGNGAQGHLPAGGGTSPPIHYEHMPRSGDFAGEGRARDTPTRPNATELSG
jgi:hypothetical protein